VKKLLVSSSRLKKTKPFAVRETVAKRMRELTTAKRFEARKPDGVPHPLLFQGCGF